MKTALALFFALSTFCVAAAHADDVNVVLFCQGLNQTTSKLEVIEKKNGNIIVSKTDERGIMSAWELDKFFWKMKSIQFNEPGEVETSLQGYNGVWEVVTCVDVDSDCTRVPADCD